MTEPIRVASGLLIRDRRVVMVENAYDGQTWWSAPGGRAEPGETFADALTREVFEETGLTVGPRRELAFVHEVRVDVALTVMTYRCFSWSPEAFAPDDPDDAIKQVVWLSFEDALERIRGNRRAWMHPPLEAYLRDLRPGRCFSTVG